MLRRLQLRSKRVLRRSKRVLWRRRRQGMLGSRRSEQRQRGCTRSSPTEVRDERQEGTQALCNS